jgi:hypothetical protein
MAQRPTERTYTWLVYRLRGTPAQLIGIIYAPDEESAIKKTIEEYGVPENQRDRLVAQRRD